MMLDRLDLQKRFSAEYILSMRPYPFLYSILYPTLSKVQGAGKKLTPKKKAPPKSTPKAPKGPEIKKPSVPIPPKYLKFVDGSGDLGNIETWKVQVQVGNSVGRDEPGVGGWGKVGYCFVNPKTKEVVPIARSDEHHSGWDLMHDLASQKVITGLKDFVPIYIYGTHVYDSEDKESYRKAFQTWLDLGGKDIKVEIYRTGSVDGNERFLGTLSDFIEVKSFTPVKGEMAKPGISLIKALEKYALAVTVALKDPSKEGLSFKAAEGVLFTLDRYRTIGLFDRDDQAAVQKALDTGDFQKVQDSILGLNGLKNKIHQSLRQEVAKPGMWYKNFEQYFGDVEAAKKAFDALGDI
jgi:hypothetical protein